MDHPRRNTLALALAGLAFATTGFAMSQKPDPMTIGIECQIAGTSSTSVEDLVCPSFINAVSDFWENSSISTDISDKTNNLVFVLHATVNSDYNLTFSVEWDTAANWVGGNHKMTQTLGMGIKDGPLNAAVMQRGFSTALRDIQDSL